jgi:hypothetical protein
MFLSTNAVSLFEEAIFLELKVKKLSQGKRLIRMALERSLVNQKLPVLQNSSRDTDWCGIEYDKIEFVAAKAVGNHAENPDLVFSEIFRAFEIDRDVDVGKRLCFGPCQTTEKVGKDNTFLTGKEVLQPGNSETDVSRKFFEFYYASLSHRVL